MKYLTFTFAAWLPLVATATPDECSNMVDGYVQGLITAKATAEVERIESLRDKHPDCEVKKTIPVLKASDAALDAATDVANGNSQ